jgi:hypothetical protein
MKGCEIMKKSKPFLDLFFKLLFKLPTVPPLRLPKKRDPNQDLSVNEAIRNILGFILAISLFSPFLGGLLDAIHPLKETVPEHLSTKY